jgi:copper chaperone
MEATYKVEGMTCGGCAASVTKALQRIGLEVREVSLDRHEAKVAGAVDDAKVKAAIEAAGYDFGGKVG